MMRPQYISDQSEDQESEEGEEYIIEDCEEPSPSMPKAFTYSNNFKKIEDDYAKFLSKEEKSNHIILQKQINLFVDRHLADIVQLYDGDQHDLTLTLRCGMERSNSELSFI